MADTNARQDAIVVVRENPDCCKSWVNGKKASTFGLSELTYKPINLPRAASAMLYARFQTRALVGEGKPEEAYLDLILPVAVSVPRCLNLAANIIATYTPNSQLTEFILSLEPHRLSPRRVRFPQASRQDIRVSRSDLEVSKARDRLIRVRRIGVVLTRWAPQPPYLRVDRPP
ncbi:hypothetical protein OG21DRAFT_1604642, partial [Imleria badia]